MEVVGRVFGALFGAWLAVFGWMPVGANLALLSLILGLLMLRVFAWVGDVAGLERAKDRMQAHLMELRLFEREPLLVFRAIGRLFYWNFRFMFATLKPVVVATLPMILLLIQMEHYYGVRPLRAGEATLVTAQLRDLGSAESQAVTLQAVGSVTVETPPVRSWRRGLVSWRIRAGDGGQGSVRLLLGKLDLSKSVTISERPTPVSIRRASQPGDVLLHPIEPGLAPGPVAWIEVTYPHALVAVGGLELHWLVWFFLISLFGALIVRWAVNSVRPNTL